MGRKPSTRIGPTGIDGGVCGAPSGSSWTLVFRGTPLPGVREVCEDAMAETPGLVVKFIVSRA